MEIDFSGLWSWTLPLWALFLLVLFLVGVLNVPIILQGIVPGAAPVAAVAAASASAAAAASAASATATGHRVRFDLGTAGVTS
jgi:hypothetical protein